VIPGLRDWWDDLGAAIPNRRQMLAVLSRASETAEQDASVVLADALGDRDLALSALRTSLTRYRGKVSGAWFNSWLLVHSGARADPRFKALMREAGMADFWRQSGQWSDFCGPVGANDFECH
jgi:hypothetical protein